VNELPNLEVQRLSESTTKEAFEKRDWPMLRAHLDDVGLDEPIFEALLGHLRRASGFIIRRPNRKQQLRRDEMFRELREFVRLKNGDSAALRVSGEVSVLLHAERGYHDILATLAACDISKLSPDMRAAAYIRRATSELAELMDRHDKTVRKLVQITMPNNPTVEDVDGRSISIDGVVDAVVTGLSTTLVMESYTNSWHDAHDVITLPLLPQAGEAEVYKAGSTQLLAMCWRRWRQTEERLRFRGGALEQHTAPDLPDGTPSGVTNVTVYRPDDAEFFDYAANGRVLDRLGQQFMEMMTETRAVEKVSGISGPLPLLPAGIVSLEEFHAAAALGDILKYEIVEDTERPGGLRLLEWLRGYAVLQHLANDSYKSRPGEAGLTSIYQRADLSSLLERCGLLRPSAECFLDHATFKISSDDLFDSPLIRMHDGSLVIFGPALLTANLTLVVLSTLATLEISLPRKGRSLEVALVSLLRQQKLDARGFKVKRDGQEYEFDAVLVWGEYVFVFECKNRSLSGNRPVNAYYFDLEIHSAVRQVKRLAEALRRYPDILEMEMKVRLDSKTVVPCVFNSLPYARTGDLKGVFCTDSSSVERFFSHRFLMVKSPHRVKKNATLLHRVPLASLWKGELPGPEDLLRQLQDPIQLKIVKAHTEWQWASFAVSPTHLVMAAELIRKAWSVESMAEALGFSAAAVQGSLDSVRQSVQAVKRRAKTKARRAARKQK
jgi:hypothetical protein